MSRSNLLAVLVEEVDAAREDVDLRYTADRMQRLNAALEAYNDEILKGGNATPPSSDRYGVVKA